MAQAAVHFPCPACGRSLPWKAEMAGKRGKCKCGQAVTMPELSPEAEAMSEEVIPLGEEAAPAKPAAGCPSCGGAMAPGAVLCMNCGYNLKTGGHVATDLAAKPAPAASAARASRGGVSAGAVADARMYRRQRPAENAAAPNTKLYIALGAVLLLVAMSVGGWIIFRGTGGGTANEPKLGDDAKVEEMISEQTATDLKKWIEANSARMLAGKTDQQALYIYDDLKKKGAVNVLAFGNGVMTLSIAIELPKDPAQRKLLFEWFDRGLPRGSLPTPDLGQRYLLHYTGL